FRIVPEDEQSWTCNGPHILSLCPTTSDTLRDAPEKTIEITVDEWLQLPASERRRWRLWRSKLRGAPAPSQLEAAYVARARHQLTRPAVPSLVPTAHMERAEDQRISLLDRRFAETSLAERLSFLAGLIDAHGNYDPQ
ncbi:hypothetical protein, partial [Proteus mirabilis]|uniref:hypothetical protein n=1 Tax=Proteus mirabilis TaxID=584 RepID=UPI0013D31A5A